MVFRFFKDMSAGTAIQHKMLCVILFLHTSDCGVFVIFIDIAAVSAGTGCAPAVLIFIIRCPISVGKAVIGVFRDTVRTAGTGNRALMLSGGITCPFSVSQGVTGIFIIAVSAV